MINLENMIKQINLMPNNKEKAIKTCLLYSYLNFYRDSKQISNEDIQNIVNDINEIEVFGKHYFPNEQKSVNCLLNSTYKLNNMYKSILTYANNYNLFTIVPNTPVSIKKLFSYARDFMNYIDPNMLNLLYKLIDMDLVYECELTDFGGKCFKLDGDKSAIIIKYNTLPLVKIFTIVHEMGHAYFHYLGKDNPSLIRTNLANESMSRIMEQLFLEYLKDNHLIDKNTIDIYERFFTMHQLYITNSVYIINKLLLCDIVDADFHIENIKTRLKFDDFYNLSIIKPKDDTTQIYLAYSNNYYAYAYLLSNVIRERFKKDELETRKFLKELPILARELDANELIDLFDKEEYINATNKNTERVLSKTYYKRIKK